MNYEGADDDPRFRNPQVFEQMVASVQQSVGIDLDPATYHYEVEPRYRTRWMVAQDIAGVLDVRLEEHQQGYGRRPSGLAPQKGSEPFNLRGLLRAEEGIVGVDFPPDWAYAFPQTRHVKMEVMSSPQAINEAQVLLGRTPGEDAFKLVRKPGRSRYGSGEWLEGIASEEIFVGDTVNWPFAEHDGKLSDHIQSWFATPGEVSKSAARQAQSIIERYGDRIHLQNEDRPAEVDRLAEAVDNLSGFTLHLWEAVAALESTTAHDYYHPRVSPMLNIWQKVNRRAIAGEFSEDFVRQAKTSARDFQALGMIPPEYSRAQAVEALKPITRKFVTHIAGLFITLDELRPLPRDVPRLRSSRNRLLHAVVNTYGEAA